MKRKLIVVALGSLFALPAIANYELYSTGVAPAMEPSTKSSEQVRAEFVAARRAGEGVVIAELGTMAIQPAQAAGKSREQVRAEILEEQQAGAWFRLGQRG